MIGMSVCNQDQINALQSRDFLFAPIMNRVRQPGINKQNMTVGRNNLETGLAIPGELRVHEFHETENGAHGKSGEHRLPANSVRQAICFGNEAGVWWELSRKEDYGRCNC
jgi:hypothetical protein